MKKLMKKFVMTLSVLTVGFVTSANVFAMTPTWPNDAKFTRGVSKAYYYVIIYFNN